MHSLLRIKSDWQEPEWVANSLINTWGDDGLIWLDGNTTELGRWITMATNPIDQVCCRGLPCTELASDPFKVLHNLKPGHWTGWLSYEAAAWLEPANPWRSNPMATLWMASHDPVLKFDLIRNELWIEGTDKKKVQAMVDWLRKIKSIKKKFTDNHDLFKIPIENWEWVTSTSEYTKNVKKIKELINSGDIFQANLTACCQVMLDVNFKATDIFKKLRQYCPAPFSALVIGSQDAKGEAIISASPERFIKVLPNGAVETRPIKGTRPRDSDKKKDAQLAAELVCSRKDRAENIMIADLLRNDLGKVCQPGSISISQLLGLESFAQVHHLTTVIKGDLAQGQTWVDVLQACWPGGSISGAPKLRACQRLYELEPVSRGPYCGSIIHLDWNGIFDSNIIIRSLMLKEGKLKAHAGCGIVADSNPEEETTELQWKLLPLLKALS